MESHQFAFRAWSSHKNWVLFFGAVVISSLFYSRYVLSIGMFGWFALSFFEESDNHKWQFRWWFNWRGTNRAEQAMASLPIIFFLVLVSLLWSNISEFGLSRVRLALPFIGLPLAFLHLPRLNRRDIDFLWIVCILSAVVSAAYMFFQIYLSPVDYAIGEGKSLPTPVSHVRYGLLIVLSCLLAFNLFFFKSSLLSSRVLRGSMGLIALGLAFFTLYLSVRTAWVGLIAGVLILIFDLGFRRRRVKAVLFFMIGMLTLLFVSYLSFSPIKKKIDYTLYDWKQLERGKGWSTSDATRWRSYAIAGEIFLDHPYLGAGAGDMRQEVNTRFDKRYPRSFKRILPHNQYLYWLATYGLLGFLLCLAIVLQPVSFTTARQNISHLQCQVVLLLSFLVEAGLQSSLGVGIYLVFTLVFLSHLAERD